MGTGPFCRTAHKTETMERRCLELRRRHSNFHRWRNEKYFVRLEGIGRHPVPLIIGTHRERSIFGSLMHSESPERSIGDLRVTEGFDRFEIASQNRKKKNSECLHTTKARFDFYVCCRCIHTNLDSVRSLNHTKKTFIWNLSSLFPSTASTALDGSPLVLRCSMNSFLNLNVPSEACNPLEIPRLARFCGVKKIFTIISRFSLADWSNFNFRRCFTCLLTIFTLCWVVHVNLTNFNWNFWQHQTELSLKKFSIRTIHAHRRRKCCSTDTAEWLRVVTVGR